MLPGLAELQTATGQGQGRHSMPPTGLDGRTNALAATAISLNLILTTGPEAKFFVWAPGIYAKATNQLLVWTVTGSAIGEPGKNAPRAAKTELVPLLN